MTKFWSELCAGLSRPLAKFASQMLFGIQASQDVKLSNIARAPKEDIPLIDTEKRLSHNLKADELKSEVTLLGQQMKLRILCERLLIISSQRLFGIPPFRFYALADGIRKILSQTTLSPPEAPPASLQLELTLGWEV